MALSKGFEIATLGSGLDVNQSNGDVVTIDMTTDVISEGTSNLYFTNERVDDRVAALIVAGNNVGLTYDDTANTLTIALTVAGGIDLSQNDTSDLPEDPNATISSSTMYYTDDRVNTFLGGGNAATLVTSGNVTVGGNLTVNGTTTTINSTILDVDDKNITIASGSANKTAASGGGITLDLGTDGVATIAYNDTSDKWTFNKGLTAPSIQSTGLGAAGRFVVVGANTILEDTSTLFLDSVNGRLGLGTTAPNVLFEIAGESADTTVVRMTQNNAGTDGPNLQFHKSRGSRALPSAVAVNDEIFKLQGISRGATQFVDSVNLIAAATDNLGNATYDIQTRVSNTLASRLKVLGTGAVQFNGAYKFPTSDGTANQVLATDASGTLTFETLDATIDWNVSDNYAYKTITDGGTDAIASANNDTFKVRGGDQIEVTIANNDATHGDNLLIGHATSGVTAATYGGNTAIPVIAVNAEGHITSVSTIAPSTTWTASDGVTTQDIVPGDTVLFDSGTDMQVTVSATDQITIAHNVTGANTSINSSANTFVDAIAVTAQGHVTSVGTGTLDFNVADNYAYKSFTDGTNTTTASSNTDQLTITDGDQIEATITNDTLTLGHANSGVSAGQVGSGTAVPVITVDAQGHVTALSTSAITTSWTITDSVTSQTIEGGNTLTVADGTDINAVVSATDTLTINNTSTLDTVTGRGNSTTNDMTVGAVFTGDSTGANSISDGGVSIGAGNDFNLYHYLGTNYIRATGQIIMNAPDDFRIRNGSSDWFKVEGSNGYVGIGNSAPTNPLHIKSTATGGNGIPVLVEGRENPFRGVRYNAGVDGAVLFLEHSRSNTLGTTASLNDNDEVGMLSWRAYNSSNSINGAADIQVLVDGTTGTHTPSEMIFRTQSATGTASKMVMRANGRVGIGTTSPSSELHIEKAISGDESQFRITNGAGATMRMGITGSGANEHAHIKTDSGENLEFHIGQAANSTSPNIVFASGGDVGIGAASPSTLLHIASTGSPQFRIQDNDQTNDWATIGHNNGLTSISSRKDAASGSIAFRGINSNAEFMRIEASGNVGIGTATPDEKLHVQGNIVVEAAGHAAGVYVMQKTIAATASQDIFTISNTHGAQIFQVMFNCSSSNFSVSKMFNVAHSFGNTPVTNKTVDTGAYASNNFTVNFTDVSSTGIKCAITNNAATDSADITVTLILGGSPQAVTLTKH
tara:strand:- start:1835 stop:5455 length:3621 start_codon:yes stop_codon:yes gene_type:complete